MKKIILFLYMLLVPIVVFAGNGSFDFFSQAFLAVISYIGPIVIMNKQTDANKKLKSFVKIFIIRAIIIGLLSIVGIEFLFYGIEMIIYMIGFFVLWPITIKLLSSKQTVNNDLAKAAASVTKKIVCPKCKAEMEQNFKFCTNCGNSLYGASTSFVPSTSFDNMYFLSDDECLELFIKKEMEKLGVNQKTKLIDSGLLRRKNIFNLIFSFLLFIFVCLIFFHFPIYTYIIGLIILVVVYISNNKYDYLDYLKKQVKERPGEKISNLIMLSKENLVKDNSILLSIGGLVIAVVLSLSIFSKPRIIYEKIGDDYGVRFYAFGLTNYKTAVIPDTHKGKNVVSLRGNAFSNMPYLEEVTLSDNITEIRGQAFKNCLKLKHVDLPKNLKSIGGSAFANCISLESIEFPDTVESMGGSMFSGAESLVSVKLPNNIKSLGGGMFKGCTSLVSIEIPNSVEVMGGSMFEGDTALKNVKLSNNLREIGGGAFKGCTSLESIEIPNSVTDLGGESFQGDYNLKGVILSENLTEIRGNTFENCSNLVSIRIPDSVTRIGGHAFTDDSSLRTVSIGYNSKLREIGSSAFRRCYSLRSINIPKETSINEKAFKESPTQVNRFEQKVINYKNERTISLKVGEKEYFKDSKYYSNTFISLVSVEEDEVNNVYEIRIEGTVHSTFNVEGNGFPIFVNDNMQVKVLSYDGESVSIELKYN